MFELQASVSTPLVEEFFLLPLIFPMGVTQLVKEFDSAVG
jgi:hypothetical protein